FEYDKNVSELRAPCGDPGVWELGRKSTIIKGTGELYGEDCLEQFEALLELFRQEGEGVLTLPGGMKPFYAVFERLKIEGKPKDDILTYSFAFRESPKRKSGGKTVCITSGGENLWDISYRFGIVIDRLVELNPHIRRPDIVEDGSVIRLC
ncbi:MAG: LysM peptidoglycan-binding domain-containing protein, partial [Ruminococcus sp.]|nr:LysM peptidoglycan-binding domain-containing protein [Ruminococcus sp.]